MNLCTKSNDFNINNLFNKILNEDTLITGLNNVYSELIKNATSNINKQELINKIKEISKKLKDNNKFKDVWTIKIKKKYGEILKSLKRIELIKTKRSNLESYDTYTIQMFGEFLNLCEYKIYSKVDKGLFNGIKIKKIACGGNHILLLSQYKDVFVYGSNTFGQLGLNNFEKVFQPVLLTSVSNCIEINCGYAYSAVITEENDLYTWGAGENGRLGHGTEEDKKIPVKINNDFKVKKIECGSVHTCLLDNNNRIYSFGHKIYNGHNEQQLKPKIIESLKNTSFLEVSIGRGGYHTLALTLLGHVYVWGHNRVGQLGFENNLSQEYDYDSDHEEYREYYYKKPIFLKSISDIIIIKVEAGWGHSALLTSNYKVLMCGRNYKGQTGTDPEDCPKNDRDHPFNPKFQYIDLPPVKVLSLGGEHSAALTFEDELYLWGDDEKGQLSYKNKTSDLYNRNECYTYHPYKFNQESNIKNIILGSNCTFILIKEE